MKSNSNGKALNRIGKRISQQTKEAVSRIKTSVIHQASSLTPEEKQKRIEEKAYELFQRRGCCNGNDWLDWSLAEDMVKLESTPKKKTKQTLSEEELKNLTAQKAYEIFQRKSVKDGNETFDWFVAEELVRLGQAK